MQSTPPAILVVEDDPVLADVPCDLLQHAGYAVERAADGTAGVARIEQGGIELVLLDLMLPDVDGIELCRRARAIEHDVYSPIIMLTVLGERQRHAGFLAGADDHVAKPFDTSDLLNRVQVRLRTMQGMLRRLISEDIALITELDPGLGCVEADPSQVEQMILNLVVNTRDAMTPDGRVTIQTANVELNGACSPHQVGIHTGSYVCLTVADTGCGMDAEMAERIFEPFFTAKEPGQGTGLGLSTVYDMIKQSSGDVRVQTEPGQGSAFEVYIPRVQAFVQPATIALPIERWSGNGETILLVGVLEPRLALIQKPFTLEALTRAVRAALDA